MNLLIFQPGIGDNKGQRTVLLAEGLYDLRSRILTELFQNCDTYIAKISFFEKNCKKNSMREQRENKHLFSGEKIRF